MMLHTKHPHLFIAIHIPKSVQSVLSTWTDTLRQQWSFQKWVHPADYHITLHFLGGCSPEQTSQIIDALTNIELSKPFSLSADGLGYFGQSKRPRILWARVNGELQPLLQLQRNVSKRMATLGFPLDKRPYRPHITLAKKYEGHDFPVASLDTIHLPSIGQNNWLVDEIVLYRTHMTRTPMYEKIKSFQF